MERVALVTGGTRGIGAGISRALKEEGYTVAALYAKDDQSASVFSAQSEIAVFKCDVSNFGQCQEVIRMIESDLGRSVDILVNNAGITRDSKFHEMSVEDWNLVLQTNLTSCFNMCRAAIPYMRDNGFGRIINVSSVNGQSGSMGQANYCAAKAGMIGFTKTLALENARFGVTVNVVAPGYVNTEMARAVPEKIMEKIIAKIPVQRLADPLEIARCVTFLADEKAGYITGSTLSINGGLYMQ